MKFTKPVAYQEIGGKRVEVAVAYTIHGLESEGVQRGKGEPETSNSKLETRNWNPETYGFKVASYDKTQELIIDPLLASTFLGELVGTWQWYCRGCKQQCLCDGAYLQFRLSHDDWPYDTSLSSSEAFVSKFNNTLTTLLASTFLGELVGCWLWYCRGCKQQCLCDGVYLQFRLSHDDWRL